MKTENDKPTVYNMNNFKELLQYTLDNGHVKADRTGTGTRSIFGPQLEFDLKKAFPLMTGKFTGFGSIDKELRWFLDGGTNNLDLVDQGVHIWDEWALTAEQAENAAIEVTLDIFERWCKHAKPTAGEKSMYEQFIEWDPCEVIEGLDSLSSDKCDEAVHAFFDSHDIPRTEMRSVDMEEGDLGPIYGAQWRTWPLRNGKTVDQISELIKLLKEKPDSRRLLVSAWNVEYLPDESKSPQQNVVEGKMALAPCHTLFQFYTREMSFAERVDYATTNGMIWDDITDVEGKQKRMDDSEIPTRYLSCKLYQR